MKDVSLKFTTSIRGSNPGKIAFMFMNTGDPAADAASLPSFYDSLSHGGMIVMNQYANHPVHRTVVMSDAESV
jgi:hypothetical protein